LLVFRNCEVAGSWPELVGRLERCGRWERWVQAEPALAMVAGPAGLSAALAPGVDPRTADALLGALIRLAAVDGGGDQDAVLVVLHALAEGAGALAAQLAYRCADGLAVVVAELTCQIRAFPWRRRTRAYAANLLADTKHQLWVGELRPPGTGHHPAEARPVDPLTWPELKLRPASLGGGAEQSQLELVDLLVWAAGAGVAPAGDLALLWDRVAGAGMSGHAQLAADLGVDERTLRRRRRRTIAALRDSSSAYLAAVA
jgi:hypothetical protein